MELVIGFGNMNEDDFIHVGAGWVEIRGRS